MLEYGKYASMPCSYYGIAVKNGRWEVLSPAGESCVDPVLILKKRSSKLTGKQVSRLSL